MRRVLYRILKIAVTGKPWGEAVLAEFDQTTGTWAALRWTAGGLWVAVRERPVAYGVALAAVLLAATTSFSFSVWFVPSNAMTPTLAVTSRHLVDRIGYRVTGIDHGDIVALRIPDAPGHETCSGSSACPVTASSAGTGGCCAAARRSTSRTCRSSPRWSAPSALRSPSRTAPSMCSVTAARWPSTPAIGA